MENVDTVFLKILYDLAEDHRRWPTSTNGSPWPGLVPHLLLVRVTSTGHLTPTPTFLVKCHHFISLFKC